MDTPEWMPVDRTYGRIELLVLANERQERAVQTNYRERDVRGGRPPREVTVAAANVVEDVVEELVGAAKEAGKRLRKDKARYQARRALQSIVARDQADLVVEDGVIRRSETYMQRHKAKSVKKQAQAQRADFHGITELAQLRPRDGYLSLRLEQTEAIVIEEQLRLAMGEPLVTIDAEEMHLFMSVFGRRLSAEFIQRIRRAKRTPAELEEMLDML